MARSLVVKVTCGAEDAERCNQAFTVAAAAVAAGAAVSLWLTGEAAWFGVPGRAEEFSSPSRRRSPTCSRAVLAGGTVTVCTQCAARRGIVEARPARGRADRRRGGLRRGGPRRGRAGARLLTHDGHPRRSPAGATLGP